MQNAGQWVATADVIYFIDDGKESMAVVNQDDKSWVFVKVSPEKM